MSFDIPILFIVFNRVDKTKKVFDIIKFIKPKKLFISADGPRDNKTERKNCEDVRKVFDDIPFNCELKKKFNEKNLGLKKNIKESIDWFFSIVDKGIILEDDCIPSETFFQFCKELLNKYEDNKKIMHINGTNLGLNYQNFFDESYFFSKLNHVWGWATWKRAWINYQVNFDDYVEYKKNKKINDYFIDKKISKWMTNYFDKSYEGIDNIWSTNWAYSILKKDGLCISPKLNLVKNIGFDGSGTSSKFQMFEKFSDTNLNNFREILHPNSIKYNLYFDKIAFEEKINKIDPRANFLNKLKAFFQKILN